MPNPEQVLQTLIDAVVRQDGERFFSICQEHSKLIFEHFAEWRVLPQEVRARPAEVQRYVHTLMQTARLFEDSGYPQLMALLMPPDADNPLKQWQDRFLEARQLAENGDYERCLAEAEALRDDLERSRASGPAFLDLRARLNGLRGESLFRLDRYDEALAATTLALEDCERGGDEEGVRVYRGNLASIESQSPLRPELLDVEVEVLETLSKAQRLTDLRRFRASNDALRQLLEAGGPTAVVVQRIQPHVLGRMGFNEFRLGNQAAARALIESARDLCLERDDRQGAEVYAENLVALERGQ